MHLKSFAAFYIGNNLHDILIWKLSEKLQLKIFRANNMEHFNLEEFLKK